MNRTKIEWCRNTNGVKGYTWNPVTGCLRGCRYCYARRRAYRLRGRFGYPHDEPFRPTFHPDRLWDPTLVKKPSRIFVCSMGELFSPDVPDRWVWAILQEARYTPQHTYIFLTKNPHLLARWNPWPRNAWVGATATDYNMASDARREMRTVDAPVLFLSFEPLLGPIEDGWGIPWNFWGGPFQWAIIGAQTGTGSGAHQPRREWVEELVAAADRAGIPVFEKDNLAPVLGRPLRQEWP